VTLKLYELVRPECPEVSMLSSCSRSSRSVVAHVFHVTTRGHVKGDVPSVPSGAVVPYVGHPESVVVVGDELDGPRLWPRVVGLLVCDEVELEVRLGRIVGCLFGNSFFSDAVLPPVQLAFQKAAPGIGEEDDGALI